MIYKKNGHSWLSKLFFLACSSLFMSHTQGDLFGNQEFCATMHHTFSDPPGSIKAI